MSTAFKYLRCVLPELDQTKKQKQTVGSNQENEDAIPTFISSRSRLLNRAKEYTLHLESLVAALITERENQKAHGLGIGVGSKKNTFTRFVSISDFRRSFSKDFDIDLSIFDYSFDYVEAPIDGDSKTENPTLSVQVQPEPDSEILSRNPFYNQVICDEVSSSDSPVLDELSFADFSDDAGKHLEPY